MQIMKEIHWQFKEGKEQTQAYLKMVKHKSKKPEETEDGKKKEGSNRILERQVRFNSVRGWSNYLASKQKSPPSLWQDGRMESSAF